MFANRKMYRFLWIVSFAAAVGALSTSDLFAQNGVSTDGKLPQPSPDAISSPTPSSQDVAGAAEEPETAPNASEDPEGCDDSRRYENRAVQVHWVPYVPYRYYPRRYFRPYPMYYAPAYRYPAGVYPRTPSMMYYGPEVRVYYRPYPYWGRWTNY